MTRRRMIALAGAALTAAGPVSSTRGQTPPAGDPRLLSRRRAFEAGRRLAADGWRLRDGVWTGQLGATQRRTIPVHLVAGNTYLFVMAVRPVNPAQVFSLLNAEGGLVAEKSVASDPGLAALLIEPPSSGRYHLLAEVPPDSFPCDAAVVYLYK